MRLVTTVSVLLAALMFQPVLAAEHDEEEWEITPKDYTPEKAWPFMAVLQNQVSGQAMSVVPYFSGYGASAAAIVELAHKYNLDPYRVYATGFSRSGHGLLEATWTAPHQYAAIAPVCEDLREKEQYGKRQKPDLLRYIQNTPVFLWHGDRDSFLDSGKKNYELMKAAGCNVQFGTYPGGHGPDPIYFKDIKKITDFFDKQVLNPYPKTVTKVVDRYGQGRAFWAEARVAKGSIEQDYPIFKATVREGNVIDLEANEGVRQMVFYLSPKLVDMAKPVTVNHGGKAVFTGPAAEKLTVKLRDGDALTQDAPRPLWEQLEEVRTQPNATGALDWQYVALNTNFQDARKAKQIARRVSLDIGLRPADAPDKAVITPASRKHASLDAMKAGELKADFAAGRHKLPVEAAIGMKAFGLAGSVDDPQGTDPIKLTPAGEGKSGEAVLVKLRLTNKGDKEVAGTVRLYRTPLLTYPDNQWPSKEAGGDFAVGIREQAGTRGVTWQYFKESLSNWPYQSIGLLMLNPGGLPPTKALNVKQGEYGVTFYGVERPVSLKGGASVELPLLLISVPSSNAKDAKPKVPALDKIVAQLKPELK